MPLPSQNFVFNQSIQNFGRRELDRSVSQGMGSVFRDPLLRPTEMLGHLAEAFPEEYDSAQGALSNPATAPMAAFMEAAKKAATLYNDPLPAIETDFEGVEDDGKSEMLSPQQVEYEFGHLGLRSKEPIARDQIEYMAAYKEKERREQEIWDAAPGGLAGNIAYLGAGLAGAAIDPLNVAAGFVPLGSLTGKAATFFGSKLAGRLAIGGVEGLVGAAAVEPIVYGAASQLQADYTASDALMNLALGTVLGGAIHAGGGSIKDLATAKKQRAAEGALREGVDKVNQYNEGRRRADLSPVGQEQAARTSVTRTIQGQDPVTDVVQRVDRKARQYESAAFNEANAADALTHQIKRLRMYEMAEDLENMPYGLADDIEDARIAVLDAADKMGFRATDIDDLKAQTGGLWDAVDPKADVEVRQLVEDLKIERENWKYNKRNPERYETLIDLIKKEGGLDPNSQWADEIRALIDGKNRLLGRGVHLFRKEGKGGLGIDDIGELATGPDGIYLNRPDHNQLLDDLRRVFHGTEDLYTTPEVTLADELAVHPNSKDVDFERAARMHVAEKMRPEPSAETWERALSDSPDDLREMTREPVEPPKDRHMDDKIEYSLDDIKAQDTELDRHIQFLRNEGMQIDDDVFNDFLPEWTSNEEIYDEAFGIGVACVSNG